ncbi:MAG: D-xylose transporter XylE [Bacteroidales bacterium]|nr:D-xylose transporter XylE [Bacteroidales bacterium]
MADPSVNVTNPGSKKFIATVTFIATLGGLLFGYDTAVISGTVKALESFFLQNITTDHVYACEVLIQYKLVVSLVWLLIVIILTSMIFRMFERKRAFRIAIVFLLTGISGICLYYINQIEVSVNTISAIKGFTISSALVGCIIGGAIAGRISLKLGRKKGLILAAILFAFSALGSALPDDLNIFFVKDIISFIIYSIVGGISVGLASMLTPMFIAELAPSRIRGKLVSWNQFAIIFGMLVIYFVNYYIARGKPDDWINSVGWRWMFASELIPATLFFVLLFFVPETPRFLVMADKEKKATKVLARIYNKEQVSKILTEIKSTFKDKSRYWLFFGPAVIVIGVFLSIFQQFVGINAVLYYAPEIFRTLGSNTDSALFQTIIVGAINLIFTVLAIFTVDKFGRRNLQIIGAVGMAFSMISLGFVFYFQQIGFLALIFVLVYIASFAMSWGPVTWVLLSEIFPNSIRGAMSLAVAAQWMANLAVSWTFPMMNDNNFLTNSFHHGFAYWIYGIMGFLAALFVWKFVPETKEKTLEGIEKIWKQD